MYACVHISSRKALCQYHESPPEYVFVQVQVDVVLTFSGTHVVLVVKLLFQNYEQPPVATDILFHEFVGVHDVHGVHSIVSVLFQFWVGRYIDFWWYIADAVSLDEGFRQVVGTLSVYVPQSLHHFVLPRQYVGRHSRYHLPLLIFLN